MEKIWKYAQVYKKATVMANCKEVKHGVSKYISK